MKFIEQKIKGVFIIEPTPFVDERGIFRRHFCQREFENYGLISRLSQANVSENKYKHTLRGFHYQENPHGEGKTLSCLVGKLYDIVVDLRPQSPTYHQWIGVELNQENRHSLHVPPGCAHAFITLEEGCLIHYYCSEFYHGPAERGIRYNDPFFKFVWPAEVKHISDKDRNHPDYVPVKK
jgi:dTDP-4-dehydrorhamnose 3,5-epimerase